MKGFIFGLIFGYVLFTGISHAACTVTRRQEPVFSATVVKEIAPSYLKGATVTVKLANGKIYSFPAESFKVVARQQERVQKTREIETVSCVEKSYNKNRISLLGGYGAKDGLNRSSNSNSVSVESRTGVVGGVQYQRSLTEKFSIGVQAQSNKTGSAMIGLDF